MKRKFRIAMMAALIMVMGFTFIPAKAATGPCPLYGPQHRYENDAWYDWNDVWFYGHTVGFPIVDVCDHYYRYDFYHTRCACGAPGPDVSVYDGIIRDYDNCTK